MPFYSEKGHIMEFKGSHFILGGLYYYVLKTHNMYNALIVFIMYGKSLLLLLRWDTDTVRDRFGGMGTRDVHLRNGGRCDTHVDA